MNLPSVSILIPTFARVEHLKEALFTALHQQYPNFEVVVFNDCAEQTLIVEHPSVRVVNQKEWISTVGDKRNRMLDFSSGSVVVTFDDDDLLFPQHIMNHVENLQRNHSDASLGMDCLYWERKSGMNKRGHTGIDIVFRRMEGMAFPSREIDFDIKMREQIKQKFSYSELHLQDPTYLYCWDNDSFHISGTGVIKDFINDVKRRFDVGVEPRGELVIVPALRADAQEFMISKITNPRI